MRGGADRGPCLNYWRLSYRRKFIRTLWTVPWAAGLALIHWTGLWARFVAAVFDPTVAGWADRVVWWGIGAALLAAVAQGTYTFARWRRETRRPVV
jgi:hypothetical protein